MSEQKPTIGRIVHYKLTSSDVELIDERCPQYDESQSDGRKYARNGVREGDVLPAQVTAAFGNGEHLNLVVQLDGYGTYWACSRAEGDQPGFWSWPPRV